jgi:hypothetical protein
MTDENKKNAFTGSEEGGFELPQEMHDLLAKVAKQNQAQFRMCKTMLAGFRATGETDIAYMDSYMDCLHDFMDQGSNTEELYLEYIDHIATFNPKEATERRDDLDHYLGYKTEIAYAAAYIAREVCRKQKGKDGDDFFKENCWRVGSHGHDWKIKTVGFLYHIVEDLGYNASGLIRMTRNKLEEWMSDPSNTFWMYDFDDELMPFAGEACHKPTDAEWKELEDALCLLNETTAADKPSYLARFKNKYLPIKVKIEDLDGQPSREEEHHQFLQMLWDFAKERDRTSVQQ